MSYLPVGPGWAHRLILAGCAILAVIGLLPAPVAGTDSPDTYEDAATGVHAPAISALQTAGVFDGTDCGSGRFCPTEPIPRWVIAVWLVRFLTAGNRPQLRCPVRLTTWTPPSVGSPCGTSRPTGDNRRMFHSPAPVLSGRNRYPGSDGEFPDPGRSTWNRQDPWGSPTSPVTPTKPASTR